MMKHCKKLVHLILNLIVKMRAMYKQMFSLCTFKWVSI